MPSPHELVLLGKSCDELELEITKFANQIYHAFFETNEELRHYFSRDFHNYRAAGDTLDDDHTLTPMAKCMVHAAMNLVREVEDLKIGKGTQDIEHLAAKHVSRGIKPEFYPIYGECVFAAVKGVLGDKADEATMTAWRKAYDAVSKIIIAKENEVREAAAAQPNGWKGFRKFTLTDAHEVEFKLKDLKCFNFSSDEESTSDEELKVEKQIQLTFTPVDKGKLPSFKPGQFVCLRFQVPGYGLTHKNCTLNDKESTDEKFVINLRPATDRSTCTKYMSENFKVGKEVEITMPLGTRLILETLVM